MVHAKTAVALLIAVGVSALPSSAGNEKRQSAPSQSNIPAPLLSLGYATHLGVYNSSYDVYVFKNIRFAAPPLGNLRWAKPAPPLNQSGIQRGEGGRACVQAGANVRPNAPTNAGEDCLFLDVTVPAKVIREPGPHSLPVVMWFYGGAYIVGTKEQRGGAEAMVKASGGNMIWVASNYRLGAYGFLNGVTVEKTGTPNAGFWDQHVALQWIQSHISKIGGNPKAVTAMGVSAGAGSVLHHLVFEGGKRDPLFTRAVLQSPGYTNLQDRVGQLESGYKRFEEIAGCQGKGLACLRALSEADLKKASDKANSGQRQGSFAFGPAPDGQLIMNTPTQEFAAGRYFKGIETIVSSHVSDEGTMFADSTVDTDAKFDALIDRNYGNSSELAESKKQVNKLYPPVSSAGSPFKTERERLGRHVTEGSFTCHNRIVADAYQGKTYVVQYAVPPSTHGSDQSGTFFNPQNPQYAMLPKEEIEARQGFQSYLVSLFRTGNPNSYRNNATTIEWPLATGYNAATLGNVLNVDKLSGKDGFKLVDDQLMVKERCQWWSDVQKNLAKVLKQP